MVNIDHWRYVMPIFKDFAENGELLQIRFEQLDTVNLPRYIKVDGLAAACGYLDAISDSLKSIEASFEKDEGNGSVHDANHHYIGKKNKEDHLRRISFLEDAKRIVSQNEDSTHFIGMSTNSHIHFKSYFKEYGLSRAKGYVTGIEDLSKEIETYFTRVFKNGEIEKSTNTHIGGCILFLFTDRNNFLKSAKPILESYKR